MLSEIFIDETAFDDAVKILKDSTKLPVALIDNKNNYIAGRNAKAGFAAWYYILKSRGKINDTPPKKLAVLLNKSITNLNINEKTLRTNSTKAYKKYSTKFSSLI